MLRLEKPQLKHKEKYQEMIKEWQEYGGPFVPCIVEQDCSRKIEELDYNATLKVVEDYRKGIIFDYDKEYFKSSDFLFIFDEEELIGVGEIRHNLQRLGINTLGHIACGIRPTKRKQGYARKAVECMIEKLKKEDVKEIIICHYKENTITPKIIKSLGFTYQNSIISEVSNKEIKRYTKKI